MYTLAIFLAGRTKTTSFSPTPIPQTYLNNSSDHNGPPRSRPFWREMEATATVRHSYSFIFPHLLPFRTLHVDCFLNLALGDLLFIFSLQTSAAGLFTGTLKSCSKSLQKKMTHVIRSLALL